jgi:membrane protein
MSMKLRNLSGLVKQTYSDWTEDKGPRMGAALAYYAIFSIPPLMMIAIAIIGFVYAGDVTGRIQTQLATLVGDDAAKAMFATPASAQKGGLLAGLLGVIVLLFGASGVFAELQEALNTIWEVKPKEASGVKAVVKNRFLSFTMVLGMCFLLLVSLVISAAVAFMSESLSSWIPGGEAVGHILELSASFAVITLVFAMIFKFVPDIDVAWDDVWIGAIATALLFTIGKFVIGMYIGKSSIGTAYGAAGSVVILITWVYYSAQILYFGAEFTHIYATKHGSHFARKEPTPNSPVKLRVVPRPAAVPAVTQPEPRSMWNYVVVAATWVVAGLMLGRKNAA